MIAAEDTALVLLAAGRSQRFGDADKLVQPFLGRPLALHVVVALEAVPFCERIAVTCDTDLDFAEQGYHVVHNDRPTQGQARSVCLGVDRVRQGGAKAVLIALADMPRVTATHVLRLLDDLDGLSAVVASSDGTQPMPPAAFGRDHFDALCEIDGDEGARALIRAGRHVVAPPAELVDIDTPEQLDALRRRVR